MPTVSVPDAARSFAADHARAHGRIGNAFLAVQRAVAGGRDTGHDLAANADLRELRRRVIPEPAQVDVEAAARVEVREFIAQAQVAVRHVRDAAPLAAGRPE